MVRVVVGAALLVFLAVAGALAQGPAQSDVRPNIAYGTDPTQHLDLCVPAASVPAGRPAVVMIHGGYWTVGDKGAYAWICKMAADEGIVAATIDYRLANGDPHNYWPAQAVDAQLAVRWLRSRASEFGVDPSHICVLGDSAGAQIALYLAAVGHTVPGDDSNELSAVSSHVACAVDNFGPTDLTADTMWPPDKLLFGSDGKTRPVDQERAASPLFMIGGKTPPIMIAHGREDKSVHIDQSQALLAALKQDHVPARMTVFEGGHEFEGLTPQQIQGVLQSEFDFIKHPRGE